MAITEKLVREALDELNFAFAPEVVLFAALRLNIFSAIEQGGELNSIASATGYSPRGLRMLLNCLTAMGLLEKEGETYHLNDLARRYCLPSSEDYIGKLFMHFDRLLGLWLTLPEAVRKGRPTLSMFTDREKEDLNRDIAEALFQVHRPYAWKLAALWEEVLSQGAKIVDVAAGSAVWSLPFALKYESAEVTAVDLSPVLAVARKYARKFGVEHRYRFVAGDIREIEFGIGDYDLAILGHICHSEGPAWSEKLIGKCFRALRQNGKLMILDYIPDEERKSETLPLLLAVNALLGTEEGDTFTFSEYSRWLRDAGFRDIRALPLDDHSPVIVGTRGS